MNNNILKFSWRLVLFCTVFGASCVLLAQDRILKSAEVPDGVIEEMPNSQMQTILEASTDSQLRGRVALALARRTRWQFVNGHSQQLFDTVVESYSKVKVAKNSASLLDLHARLELSSFLINNGKVPEGRKILENLIEVKAPEVFESEKTPEYIELISQVHPREGLAADSPEHKEIVKTRIENGMKVVLKEFQDIQSEAGTYLGEAEYGQSGSAGLKQLCEKYKDNPIASTAMKNLLVRKLTAN